jgi:hypothetical protein
LRRAARGLSTPGFRQGAAGRHRARGNDRPGLPVGGQERRRPDLGAVQTWGEALADIASLLYLKRAAPERWSYFAEGIAAMRHDLAGKWPEHDTSAWLHRVIAANAAAAPGQSVFEAAFELRRRFKPGT